VARSSPAVLLVALGSTVLVGSHAAGRETILLVEDDDQVRALARQMLEGCGYGVLVATDGTSALALYEERGDAIDLVLTDVVMPGMSGLDLRRQLRSNRPGVKVLCMSGYSERVAFGAGAADDGVDLIHKPFTAGALAGRVRALLDGDAAPASAMDPAGRA
jgi:DNA-binding response OmpR family regulator